VAFSLPLASMVVLPIKQSSSLPAWSRLIFSEWLFAIPAKSVAKLIVLLGSSRTGLPSSSSTTASNITSVIGASNCLAVSMRCASVNLSLVVIVSMIVSTFGSVVVAFLVDAFALRGFDFVVVIIL